MLRKKLFKIFSTVSAVIIAFFSFCISASAATTSLPFENLTVKEAVLWSCYDSGTLIEKIGDLAYEGELLGYSNLYFETFSGNKVPSNITTVLGALLNPSTDIYSVSIDILFPSPVYISWAAIQKKGGGNVKAEITPIYGSDLPTKVVETLTPNKDDVYGYNFSWPVRSDYNGYIMFHLVTNFNLGLSADTWSAPGIYNMYADFNFEFYYSAPNGSAIGDLKDREDNLINSEVKILTGYDSFGNPIYSDGTLSDFSKSFQDDLTATVKSLLLTSRTSLMAAGNFLSKLFGISGINGLLFLSLALGIVPLIVGLGVSFAKRSDERSYRTELAKSRAIEINQRKQAARNRRGK